MRWNDAVILRSLFAALIPHPASLIPHANHLAANDRRPRDVGL